MAVIPATGPSWVPPPPDECEESANYPIDPSGGDMTRERVIVRMMDHIPTSTLVDFAVIQQTYRRGSWRTVAEADSAHDYEVHIHRWSRTHDARVGKPEQILAISSADDVLDGYNMAYGRIVDAWEDNKRRWRDA
jgi:hypothetical protein